MNATATELELGEISLSKSSATPVIHTLPVTATGSKTSIPANGVTRTGNSQGGEPGADANGNVIKKQVRTERIHFLVCCWTLFLAGWNDASTGPLLPRIQRVYDVGFTVVSLLFVLACVGFLIGTALNVPLTDKYGFGKVMLFGSVCQVMAYAIQASAPPYPLFVISFAINGIGLAVQDAQANGYVARFQRSPSTKMGVLHAAYGLGALVSPLVATQFAQLKHWSFHYLCSLGVALINSIVIAAVFRGKNTEECLAKIGVPPGETVASEHSKFRQILSLKSVHLLAMFILVYVGIEVTIGGWIVTFVQQQRGGGPEAGYVSSGFFGGLTLGRVALLWVNKMVGERNAIYLYTILAIGLELVVWLVPNLYGSAVAVSLVGVILGPFYPIAMNYSGRILPHWLLTGSIGFIAGMGQTGSALLPFMTGALSGRFGIQSLQPLLVAMMAVMMGLWWLVPNAPRRVD